MRAVVFKGLGSVDHGALAEVDTPTPGPGELLVEVHAAPVNYVDLVTLSGRYQVTPTVPYIPGKGPAGVVRAAAPDLPGVSVGDRVLAMVEYGGYAQFVTAAADHIFRLPDSLSFVEAASMSLAFDTAWMALRERARMTAGDSVLVLGATGAVGSAALQLARAMGASRVLAGVSSPERTAQAIELGADAVVDLSLPNLRTSVRDQVDAATQSEGVDIVIDPIGGAAFDGALRCLKWRGTVVVVGFAAGRIPVVKVNYLLLKNIEVSGLQISDYRRRTPELMAECYRELFGFLDAGSIRPLESTTYPLSEWKTALRMIEGRQARERLVLLPFS